MPSKPMSSARFRAELVGAFADQNRLDEIIMGVCPVFLGRGAPLLPRRLLSSRVRLTRVFQDQQIVELTYELTARGNAG